MCGNSARRKQVRNGEIYIFAVRAVESLVGLLCGFGGFRVGGFSWGLDRREAGLWSHSVGFLKGVS